MKGCAMKRNVDEILKEALDLPLDQRLTLVHRILDQNDAPLDDRVCEPTTVYDCQTVTDVKKSARQIIENISNQCTWDDLLYKLYVRQKIDRGLDDIAKGRVVAHEDVRRVMLAQ
jgi:hypothetical protein